MLKEELEKNLKSRIEVLTEIIDSQVASACEAKSTLETIRYLSYILKNEE